MPAGLSQITQSNFSRSSSMTFCTPSSVSASLSRVCEAGSSDSVSSRLSRISACGQLGVALHHVDQVEHHAAFRAHHQIEVAQADVEIDHHDVGAALRQRSAQRGGGGRLADAALAGCHHHDLAHLLPPFLSVQGSHFHQLAVEPGLHRTAAQRCVHVVGGLIDAVDRHQLGIEPAAEDAARGLPAKPAIARPRSVP